MFYASIPASVKAASLLNVQECDPEFRLPSSGSSG